MAKRPRREPLGPVAPKRPRWRSPQQDLERITRVVRLRDLRAHFKPANEIKERLGAISVKRLMAFDTTRWIWKIPTYFLPWVVVSHPHLRNLYVKELGNMQLYAAFERLHPSTQRHVRRQFMKEYGKELKAYLGEKIYKKKRLDVYERDYKGMKNLLRGRPHVLRFACHNHDVRAVNATLHIRLHQWVSETRIVFHATCVEGCAYVRAEAIRIPLLEVTNDPETWGVCLCSENNWAFDLQLESYIRYVIHNSVFARGIHDDDVMFLREQKRWDAYRDALLALPAHSCSAAALVGEPGLVRLIEAYTCGVEYYG